MNRIYAGLAALALMLVGAGTAHAQAPARQPVAITVAKACGTVTLTFVNPETVVGKAHTFQWNAVNGNTSTSVGIRSGLVTVGPKETKKETIPFIEDEFGGVAAVTVAVILGPDTDIQPRLDIYPVDTDCKTGGATTTTPAPTTTVAPTTTPAPTTTQPVPRTSTSTSTPLVTPAPLGNSGNLSVNDDDNDSFVPNTSQGVDTGDGSTEL